MTKDLLGVTKLLNDIMTLTRSVSLSLKAEAHIINYLKITKLFKCPPPHDLVFPNINLVNYFMMRHTLILEILTYSQNLFGRWLLRHAPLI